MAISVAMFEGELAGGFMGAFAGFCCDLFSSYSFGYYIPDPLFLLRHHRIAGAKLYASRSGQRHPLYLYNHGCHSVDRLLFQLSAVGI